MLNEKRLDKILEKAISGQASIQSTSTAMGVPVVAKIIIKGLFQYGPAVVKLVMECLNAYKEAQEKDEEPKGPEIGGQETSLYPE